MDARIFTPGSMIVCFLYVDKVELPHPLMLLNCPVEPCHKIGGVYRFAQKSRGSSSTLVSRDQSPTLAPV
jgi:hypothetical protein